VISVGVGGEVPGLASRPDRAPGGRRRLLSSIGHRGVVSASWSKHSSLSFLARVSAFVGSSGMVVLLKGKGHMGCKDYNWRAETSKLLLQVFDVSLVFFCVYTCCKPLPYFDGDAHISVPKMVGPHYVLSRRAQCASFRWVGMRSSEGVQGLP
jgi:hypothetical protein